MARFPDITFKVEASEVTDAHKIFVQIFSFIYYGNVVF